MANRLGPRSLLPFPTKDYSVLLTEMANRLDDLAPCSPSPQKLNDYSVLAHCPAGWTAQQRGQSRAQSDMPCGLDDLAPCPAGWMAQQRGQSTTCVSLTVSLTVLLVGQPSNGDSLEQSRTCLVGLMTSPHSPLNEYSVSLTVLLVGRPSNGDSLEHSRTRLAGLTTSPHAPLNDYSILLTVLLVGRPSNGDSLEQSRTCLAGLMTSPHSPLNDYSVSLTVLLVFL